MIKTNYTIIKNKDQYFQYCNRIEELIKLDYSKNQDEIELLELLIEKWDDEHSINSVMNPIQLLNALMSENKINATDLVEILNLSKGTISKMLNYHKGISKESIRKLSDYFKVSQEMFNKPYNLVTTSKTKKRRNLQTN